MQNQEAMKISTEKKKRKTRREVNKTHYKVSGGPIIETLHWKTLVSSTSPAEKPSTGFLHRSERSHQQKEINKIS